MGSVDVFDPFQTSNGTSGSGGDGFASMLLGLPTYAEIDSVYSGVHGGKIFGTYFSDQWRVNDRLTLNLGLRYDITDWPRGGQVQRQQHYRQHGPEQRHLCIADPAPACSATQEKRLVFRVAICLST